MRPTPSRSRVALAALSVGLVTVLAACGGGSSGKPAIGEPVVPASSGNAGMMSDQQMDQLQAALAKGVAQGPLASTTTTAG